MLKRHIYKIDITYNYTQSEKWPFKLLFGCWISFCFYKRKDFCTGGLTFSQEASEYQV